MSPTIPAWPRRALAIAGWASLPASAAALTTLYRGRTLLFWPSVGWGSIFLASAAGMLMFWLAVAGLRRLGGTRDDLISLGLPLLALADGFLILAFLYLHDGTNHLVVYDLLPGNLIAEPDFQAFILGKLALLGLGWLVSAFWRRRGGVASHPTSASAGFDPAAVLIVVLALTFYVRIGVFSVLEIEVPSDLRVNYVAALALREGLNPYDNAIALQVAQREAIPYVGTETWTVVTNPPTAMLYFAPFTLLPLSSARVAFLAVNQVLLVAAIVLMFLAIRPSRPWLWLALLFAMLVAFDPLIRTLRLGQVDVAILLLLALALFALTRGRHWLAGAAVGAAVAFKLVPALLALYFLWKRDWRALGCMALASLGFAVLALWFAGPDTFWFYLTERLPGLLAGTALWHNLSLPGLVNRLAVGTDLGRDYWGRLPAIPLASALSYLWTGALLVLAAVVIRRRPADPRLLPVEFGAATAVALLAAGVTWPHYALWLLPALAFMLTPEAWAFPRTRRIIVAALVGVGAALVAMPYPELFRLLGGFFNWSVLAMSLGNLGLLMLAAGLALALHELRLETGEGSEVRA